MLSFRLPYPLSEGFKLRAYNISKILAKEYDVDLLSLHNGPIHQKYLRHLKGIFDQITCYPLGPVQTKLRALMTLGSAYPLQVGYHYLPKAKRWLNEHRNRYDLFFCVHLRMARYLEHISQKKVIDLIDATSLLYKGANKYATGLWKWIYGVETPRLRSYELKIIQEFDKAFISSPYDNSYLLDYLPSLDDCITVIPNGVREQLLDRANDTGKTNGENWLLFLGKMDYAPNVDAVINFCKSHWPQLRKSSNGKDLKFLIVGTSPRQEILDLEAIPGVEATGFLEDPFSYMLRAKVIVVPLRYSAGIQNKVLEAMALGKPVVTTPWGARGIEGISGKHFLVVKEEHLVPEILSLLKDPKKREYLGRKARELVKSKYRWEVVGERLLKEVGAIVSS